MKGFINYIQSLFKKEPFETYDQEKLAHSKMDEELKKLEALIEKIPA
jgi:hypothetical protein